MAIEDQDGVKISDMPDLSSITGKEYFPVVDSAGTNRKVATSLLATKTELEGKADKSEIVDMATKTWIGQQGFLTEHQDISQLATKQEVTQGLSGKQDTLQSGTTIKTINGQSILGSGDLEIQTDTGGISDAPSDGKKYVRSNGNWVEETTVDTSNFATKTELEGKVDDSEIADMLTKTEAASTYQPIGDYLTAIPDEYVTETELNGKGYATTTQLSDAVADKLTKTQADGYYQATGDYALKSEIPDVSGFITSTQADEKYATLEQIGNIDTILDEINGEVI
jgi:hypothetical protein